MSKCWSDTRLCLPCYVDVLEVRQMKLEAGGVMAEGEVGGGDGAPTLAQLLPGTPPRLWEQVEMFEPRERYR